MKKIIIIFIALILICTNSFSQDRTQQRIEAGDNFFKQRQYYEAIDVYERILRREDATSIKREVSFKLGDSYRMVLNYNKAKNWYKTALNLGYDDPVIYLNLSEMFLGLEEFDKSIEYANKFLELKPDNERGLKFLESAKYSKEHYDRETIFEVSLEESLSSDGEEWGVAYLENRPIFHDDPRKYDKQFDIEIRLFSNNLIYWALRSETPKERIVFSSTRIRDEEGMVSTDTDQGFSNIYQVLYNQQENDWDPINPVRGGINSDYYDGFLTYDENNQVGYFMNCGGFEGERETCDIYKSKYNTSTDHWEKATLFDYNSDNYNIGYPSINKDGNVIYFASDNPDGHGGYDLYKIYRDDNGEWGEPQNLGPKINTRFNDAYPYIAGNVLYFSSFGHPGMGGFDIFYSIIDENGNYSKPQNMGSPINSSADDFGFIINDDYSQGFFSSNRPGGSGTDDIYSFRVTSKSITLQGIVTDKLTEEPLINFDFQIFGDDDSFYLITTDDNGKYKLPDLSTDVNYVIEAFDQDYEDFSEKIQVKDQLISSHFEVVDHYDFNIQLTPKEKVVAEKKEPEKPDTEKIEIDEEVAIHEEDPIEETVEEYVDEEKPVYEFDDYELPTIYFDFAKYDLRQYSKKQLDSIADFLHANRNKGLIIHGHTDEIAGHLINFYLSQARAHSAIDYLIKKGIDIERLYPTGHGKMNLVVENAKNDHEHQLNRRANFEPININDLQVHINDAPKNSFRYLNSLKKDVYFSEGIEFMIQFAATKNPVNPRYYQKIINEFPAIDIIYYYDKDLYHRYLAGSFSDFQKAYNILWELRELGYDTYVVAFNNGKRISISTAQSMLGNQ